jgi:mRNA interferase MazF
MLPQRFLKMRTWLHEVLGVTDYELQDWGTAGLRLKSAFRCFLVTLPATAKPTLIGHLSERDWRGVRNSVKTSLADLNDP